MVKHLSPRLDATFGALSDATRRAILARLALGGATVSDLAQPFQMSLPAVSKHVKILERAGLVARRKKGREHHLSLRAEAMKAAAQWMEFYRRFWEDHLAALKYYLETPGNTK
jgi:DNA-binding transcriptional ArsR family regulator